MQGERSTCWMTVVNIKQVYFCLNQDPRPAHSQYFSFHYSSFPFQPFSSLSWPPPFSSSWQQSSDEGKQGPLRYHHPNLSSAWCTEVWRSWTPFRIHSWSEGLIWGLGRSVNGGMTLIWKMQRKIFKDFSFKHKIWVDHAAYHPLTWKIWYFSFTFLPAQAFQDVFPPSQSPSYHFWWLWAT